VPTIVLHGADDALDRAPAEATAAEKASFTKLVARRIVAGSGHFMPREKPEAVSAALLEVLAATK
jgi:pimeloyl-ACP methyl ester carboxylesterase